MVTGCSFTYSLVFIPGGVYHLHIHTAAPGTGQCAQRVQLGVIVPVLEDLTL